MNASARLPLPPSLYADTAVAPIPTPPLDADRNVSVAIIGGGFTGLSTALHLAEQGVPATVLEAQEPGWGASGNNGGQVNPGLKHDPDQIEADFGAELGRRMIDFSYGATNFTLDLIRRYQIPCEARQNGTLRAAYNAASAAAIEATAKQCIRRGMPVTLLDATKMREITGTDRYLCAMLDARGGDLHPLSYARGLARAAIAAGAAVHGETPALSLCRDGARWRIETPRAVVHAEKVLLATNGFTDNLWPALRRTIVPVFSSIAATAPLSDDVARAIMPTRSVLYESGHITVYYRIDQHNRLLMGGRGPMRWIRKPSDVSYFIRYAERLWPQLKGVTWTHGWNSRLAITADHYPHVHEPAENLLISLGCNGRGVALSTAMGAQLARRLIGGANAEIDMPVTGIKPIAMHAFWPLGVTAAVLAGRVRDRLGM
ncbi:FAD-binding oxidoreductase [Bradyrhizobium sp. Ash2021]|uniref:NAD(P)/FAD-dependent oxidoreductase n=1 Tax=Bradyrhizobium sp. Ash2021 TaxID=2954771 RepID=UPI0028160CE3|nr:FAD-binding oxidoreductase [Bradyrhizobium sp. Ash2021]WMT73626.1 FAD-binding oxidoreductase [Bradyrhizobium sp. Ash2021]